MIACTKSRSALPQGSASCLVFSPPLPLLAAINHGQALLTGHFTVGELLPLCLTYCVPFAVAMYSQAQGKRQRDLSTRELVVTNEQRAIETAQHEQLK